MINGKGHGVTGPALVTKKWGREGGEIGEERAGAGGRGRGEGARNVCKACMKLPGVSKAGQFAWPASKLLPT